MLEDYFCDIIKKARTGLGLTIEEIALQAGLSTQAIRELETGRRSPDRSEIPGIASALELDGSKLASIACDGWIPASTGSLADAVTTIHGDIGGYAVKGYLLRDTESRAAVIVDTGYNPDAMLTAVEQEALQLKAVCLTHGHHDHAGGLDQILAKFPVPVYIGEDDWALLHWKPPVSLRRFVKDDDGMDLGRTRLSFMRTPGHTPGGVCYQAPGCVFVGDTLFAGSIGRANPATLYKTHLQSVRRRLLVLPDDLTLFPGHGPATTVAEEKAHNPFG
jgi:hydroxyacylglutathione hydrolase